MIKLHQPTPSQAAFRKSLWIPPVVTVAVAVFLWGFAAGNARAQNYRGPVGNTSPQVIINNELEALGIGSPSVATTSKSTLDTALTAALYEFPAPNKDATFISDNPDYGSPTSYTPEDLTNYILAASGSNAGALASSIVTTAINTLQAVGPAYPSITGTGLLITGSNTDVIEKIVGGAIATIVSTSTDAGITANAVSSDIDNVLQAAIKLDPSLAIPMFQEAINEIRNGTPSNLSVPSTTGTSLTQTEAVNLITTAFKRCPNSLSAMPTTAAESTSGCRSRTFSSSIG